MRSAVLLKRTNELKLKLNNMIILYRHEDPRTRATTARDYRVLTAYPRRCNIAWISRNTMNRRTDGKKRCNNEYRTNTGMGHRRTPSGLALAVHEWPATLRAMPTMSSITPIATITRPATETIEAGAADPEPPPAGSAGPSNSMMLVRTACVAGRFQD